jgi:hypothetical protein
MIANQIAGLLTGGVPVSLTSYESIASASGTGSSGTITFSSISGSYSHLQIRWIARASTGGAIYARLNSDSGSNYSAHILYGNGTSALANAQSATNIPLIIRDGGISTTASTMTAGVFDLLDYASASKNSTYRNLGGQDLNGSGVIELASGAWYNTAAVTSISFIHNGGNFTTDTRFALYGIK